MIKQILLKQFRSFYFKNPIDNMENLIEYFSVFGGLNWKIDTNEPIESLIKEHILENFNSLSKKIDEITLDKRENRALLRAFAIGNREIFSAFNRAGLNNANGGSALNYLQEKGVLQIEYSREEPARSLNPHGKLKKEVARHRISHKVLFCIPFVRFWFYFVYPHAKEIAVGKYDNFLKEIKLQQYSYASLIFEELSEILLNYHLRDSQILSSGSYWDANIEIDILTITTDEKIYVAECKWRNHQVTKVEWLKLLQKCEQLGIKPTQIILFSRSGFSKELMQYKGSELALYDVKEFIALLKNIKEEELQKSEFF